MIFDGVVLLSDVDGTLSTYDRKIVPENIEAIRYFTANGGRFGVATGRTAHSAQKFLSELPINCPCLVVNGGGIYDFQTETMLYSCFLDHSAWRLVPPVIKQAPHVGIEINVDGVLHCVKYSSRSEQHVSYELNRFQLHTFDDIPPDSNWYKILFTGEPEEIDLVEAICKQLVLPNAPYYVVRSESTLFEVLPREATKGKGVIRLSEILSVPIPQIYAIGDYYNDIELLSAAGCSAAVDGAPREVIAVTDYVTCTCEKGAVADFIRYIEKKIQTSK